MVSFSRWIRFIFFMLLFLNVLQNSYKQSASIYAAGQVIPLIVWGRKNRVLPFGDTEKRQVCYLVVTMGASKRVITLKHSMFFLEQELHL